MPRKNTLRGCIIMKWKASGSHETVQYDQVLQWAKDCDSDFKKRGLEPASIFRKYVKSDDERSMKTYLKGERFPFRIVDGYISGGRVLELAPPRMSTSIDNARRACLKCGRLNLVDAVYCSYCRQLMPRGPAEEAFNR
jgi:hypothetical protein